MAGGQSGSQQSTYMFDLKIVEWLWNNLINMLYNKWGEAPSIVQQYHGL